MSAQARVADVTLDISVDERVPQLVRIDADKIGWAVSALVGNALRYVRHGSQVMPGGSIAVRVSYQAIRPSVVIEVQDDGPGIPAEKLPVLFEAGVLCGVGLSPLIVRDFVIAHAGRIDRERGDAAPPGTTIGSHRSSGSRCRPSAEVHLSAGGVTSVVRTTTATSATPRSSSRRIVDPQRAAEYKTPALPPRGPCRSPRSPAGAVGEDAGRAGASAGNGRRGERERHASSAGWASTLRLVRSRRRRTPARERRSSAGAVRQGAFATLNEERRCESSSTRPAANPDERRRRWRYRPGQHEAEAEPDAEQRPRRAQLAARWNQCGVSHVPSETARTRKPTVFMGSAAIAARGPCRRRPA